MSTDAENGFGRPTDSVESGQEDSRERNLIPVLHADEHFKQEIVFRIVDRSSFQIDVSSGFNPYDTASMYKKK